MNNVDKVFTIAEDFVLRFRVVKFRGFAIRHQLVHKPPKRQGLLRGVSHVEHHDPTRITKQNR